MKHLILFFLLVSALVGAPLPPSEYIKTWVPNVTSNSTVVGVGVNGGIPTTPSGPAFNIVTYGADATGTSSANSAISAAVAAWAANSYVGHIYAPAGRFKLTARMDMGFTIYGAGDGGVTTFDVNHGDQTAFNFGDGTSFSNPNGPDDDITDGLVDGSTAVKLGYVGDFIVGKRIGIFVSDNLNRAQIEAGTVPLTTYIGNAGSHTRMHLALVTGIDYTNNIVSFDRPIYMGIASGATGYARCGQLTRGSVGLANMTIDFANHSGGVFGIVFGDIHEPWLYRVELKNIARFGIYANKCSNFEMRECGVLEGQVVGNPGTSGLLMEYCSNALVEDNAFIGVFPGIEINYSCHGSVFAFNFFDRAIANINHGPTNYFNLYEGNIVSQIKADGYFGGTIYNSIYGNWLTGRADRTNTTGLQGIIDLKRYTYKTSLVRNYLGTSASAIATQNAYDDWGKPNIGNSTSWGFAKASAGDWWVAWDPDAAGPRTWTGTQVSGAGTTSGTFNFPGMAAVPGGFQEQAENARAEIILTWSGDSANATPVQGTVTGNVITINEVRSRNDNTAKNLPANGTSITVVPNTSSYQELDQDVEASTYRIANFMLSSVGGVSGLITSESAVGANTIAPSLFRATKPAWFGNKPWPVFDTARGVEPSYTDLPAAHRYILGNRDYMPGSSSTVNVTTLNVGTIQ